MKEKGFFYPLSKTLAERAAWDFLERVRIDIGLNTVEGISRRSDEN
tara:strand:+ start:1070 stop:1207 length:138 start_codon:yes stop_codon:yes gene_type:complete